MNWKNIFITHIALCTSGHFKSQYYCPWTASLFFHKCFQSTAAVPHWASLWNCSITLLSEPFSEYTCCNSCYMLFFFVCSSFLECSALQCLGGGGRVSCGLQSLNKSGHLGPRCLPAMALSALHWCFPSHLPASIPRTDSFLPWALDRLTSWECCPSVFLKLNFSSSSSLVFSWLRLGQNE